MATRVLLVDDSSDVLEAYVALLQNATPYEVRAVTSAREALDVVRTWHPDVVLTDLMMPEVSGLDLISRIRSDLPPPLPVVGAISGFPDLEDEARRRGAQAFQPKPVDPEDLVAFVECLLEHRQPPERLRASTARRRQAASERAEMEVAATLARRPQFPEDARRAACLLSRYFEGADVGLFLMRGGRLRPFASSNEERWPKGGEADGVLGYALDVVESGSTFVVPDLAALPTRPTRLPATGLLAGVPLRSPDDVTIGTVVLAHPHASHFDTHDLAILGYAAACGADVLAEVGVRRFIGPSGLLTEESWRFMLRTEVERLARGGTLAVGLAALSVRPPDAVLWQRLLARLPPRTAVGMLADGRLVVCTTAEHAEAGERGLRSLVAALSGEPPPACQATLAVAGMRPTDGGAAFIAVLGWLVTEARERGPGTVLRLRLVPELAVPPADPTKSG